MSMIILYAVIAFIVILLSLVYFRLEGGTIGLEDCQCSAAFGVFWPICLPVLLVLYLGLGINFVIERFR